MWGSALAQTAIWTATTSLVRQLAASGRLCSSRSTAAPCALGQGDALDAVEVTHMRWQTLGELPAVSIWGASPARGA